MFMDTASVNDSIDAEWAKFQMPDLSGMEVEGNGEGQEGASSGKGIHGKGRKAKAKANASSHEINQPVKCRGCRRKVVGDELALNFPGCWPCKRALDNLSKLASRQGEKAQEFVKEARADPDKCYAMVQSYYEKCPEPADGSRPGKKRGTWSLVRYMERVKAASGLVKDRVGELMTKAVYLEFAPTARGGRKSAAEAEAQWLAWETKVEKRDPEVLSDRQGPNGCLRVWVATADILKWRQQYMREKEVECTGEQKKKGTEEHVDAMRSEILSKHGAGVSMGFDSVAQALATNGDSAFSGRSGFLLDVLELQPDVVDEAEAEEEPETSTQEPSPKKPKVWVDRDRVISSTIRTVKLQRSTFQAKAMEQLDKQKSFLTAFEEEHADEIKEQFKGELATLKVRLEGLALCLESPDEVPLKQFIARFGFPDSPAPPCEDYDRLQPISAFLNIVEEYNKCQTPDQLKDRGLNI